MDTHRACLSSVKVGRYWGGGAKTHQQSPVFDGRKASDWRTIRAQRVEYLPLPRAAARVRRPEKPAMRAYCVVLLLSGLWANLAHADGRYQAIPIDAGPEFGMEKALILDTVSGHLWIWTESPATDEEPGGRYVIYQGLLTPGTQMGEVVLKQEWVMGKPTEEKLVTTKPAPTAKPAAPVKRK
jgi:hypothetical protein